ncbi:MAG: hypothetical protein ACOX6S_09875 [Clostridia bacterium]|jgi:hypothetical protein
MRKVMWILLTLSLFAFLILPGCTSSHPSGEIDSPPPQVESPNEAPQASQTAAAGENEEEIMEDSTGPKTYTGSGIYVGQIDANSIEIKIDGVPEEESYRAFRLDEKVKEEFSYYQLAPETPVEFEYFENEYSQPVITKIGPLDN